MNKEFPKEMKITSGGEEACARMRLLLKRAQDTIERALRDDANACMSGDNPYRFLSAAVFVLREMMRPKVGTLAFLTEITNYYCKHEPRLRLMPENAKPDEAPQAEQKKHGDLTDSIARMTACLEDVIANAKAALDLSKNVDRDGMKWMTLSKSVFDVHRRSRMGWQGLVDPAVGTGGGAFFTKKEILDFVMANPSFVDVEDVPTPIDQTAPEMLQGLGQVWKAIGTDTCGIRRANGTVRAWTIRENAGVEVFAKQHFVDGKPSSCWTFVGTVDCEKVIFGTIVGGRNKANKIVRFIRNGLLAARLRLKHKRMNRKAREDANAGEKEGC